MRRAVCATAMLAFVPAMAQGEPLNTAMPASGGAAPPTLAQAPPAGETRELPPVREWGPRAGSTELTLSGTGSNDRKFRSGSGGATGSFAWYMTPNWNVGLRQSVNIASFNGTDWNAATRGATQFHLNLGAFRPFIGAHIGYLYGDTVRNTGIIGPEAGIKLYLAPNAFAFVQTEYQIFFRRSRDIDFDRGAFAHSLGVGINF